MSAEKSLWMSMGQWPLHDCGFFWSVKGLQVLKSLFGSKICQRITFSHTQLIFLNDCVKIVNTANVGNLSLLWKSPHSAKWLYWKMLVEFSMGCFMTKCQSWKSGMVILDHFSWYFVPGTGAWFQSWVKH